MTVNPSPIPPYEIEAKFALSDAEQAGRLRTAPTLTKRITLGPPHVVTQIDCYYDTADFFLLRHGHTLRLRQNGDGAVLTIKGRSLSADPAVFHRMELEQVAVDGCGLPPWELWPEPLRRFVEEHLGEAPPLQPVCLLRQVRHHRSVALLAPPTKSTSATSQAPFAELSIDEVEVLACGPPAPQSEAAPDPIAAAVDAPVLATFWELEAELLPGADAESLHGLVHGLRGKRALKAQSMSKLERALAIVHSHLYINNEWVAAVRPELHMADACRLFWRRQLGQLLLNEAGVRYSSDIEYVHDMRVAVRRMRTALRFFGEFFRGKALRRIRKALRITGRRLGAVRDLDVALDRLRRHARYDEAGDKTEFERVAGVWEAERAAAHAALLAWLDSAAYRRFLARFGVFCSTAGKGARRYPSGDGDIPTPHEVRHVLPTLLMGQFSQVRAFEAFFATEEVNPETLHRLRIQCKYLRYNLEFAQSLMGRSSAGAIRALKALQDHLGELNDAVVSRAKLSAVEEGGRAVGQYEATQNALIEAQRNAAQSAYEACVGPAQRRSLGRAIMQI
ncbi:MAG: CHAD domain-containing protein [Caldilineaceae bacterium]|nr:CHAD domain-containing protein [Caldilineaceae bacterium]